MRKCQYNNIDLFKIIFAVIVVMIHTSPFMDISDNVSWLFSNTVGNLAVPFFFVTSGFLLFEKLANSDQDSRDKIVKKYLIHIIRMYLIWCVIWIPWKALNYYNIGAFTIVDYIKYIRDIIFVAGGDALWYLPALAAAVYSVYMLRYKTKTPKFAILILALILYVTGCMVSSWYGIFENSTLTDVYYKIFVTVDNGILNGMMFVAIGMVIAENEKEQGRAVDIAGFIVTLILLFVESYMINKTGLNKDGVCNNLVLPGVAFFMFRLILRVKIKGNEEMFRRFRDYSTIIYLSHCFIIRSIMMLLGAAHINLSHTILCIITLTLSFVFSACVRCMAKKYSWLKLLY